MLEQLNGSHFKLSLVMAHLYEIFYGMQFNGTYEEGMERAILNK